MENDKAKFKNEFKKRLYVWALKLVRFIDKLPRDSVCNVMGKQLLRSGTSVLANHAEARAASSKKDFINFFTYSLKSANESKIWLELLRDSGKDDKNDTEWLLKELGEISNIIASGIITMKSGR